MLMTTTYRIRGTQINRRLTQFQYPPLASDIDFRGTQEDPHAVSALLKMYLRQCKLIMIHTCNKSQAFC